MNTHTTAVATYTTAKGNSVTVYRTRVVGHNGTMVAMGRTVRVYARVNNVVSVHCDEVYQAWAAVTAAGY